MGSLATLGMTDFGRRRRYQLRGGSAHAAARAGRSSSEITAKNVGRASGGDSDARSGTTFFAALREEHAAVQQRCTAARRTMSSPVFGGQQVAIDGRATERHSSTIEVRAMNCVRVVVCLMVMAVSVSIAGHSAGVMADPFASDRRHPATRFQAM